MQGASAGSCVQRSRRCQLPHCPARQPQVEPVVWVALQAIPQKLRLNKRSGWAVLLGILAAFCFGAVGPAGYSTARPPQEVMKVLD